MTYLEMIYQEIGEILKLIQYIEWNLCLALDIDGLSETTLGQLKTRVIEEDIFNEEQANELLIILEKRNDLVHKYFKRLDFEKHSDNIPFLVNQLRYLKKLNAQVQDFNSSLVE